MNTLYDRIISLCESTGITGGKLCKDIGIQRSLLTDLKMERKKTLSSDTLSKISEYFGVSVDSLLGKEQKDAPILNKKDERDIARELERMMSDLESGGSLMFDGNPMTQEARESIKSAMKLGLQAAKLKNKERFTPKKYR